MQNSYMVKWSSTFSVGIKLIDDQHKGLLDLVNDLFRHSTGNEAEEREYFQKVIQQAVDYVKVHFATEEKIMLQTKFTGYAEHKRVHDGFVLTVVDSVRDFHAGKKFALAAFTKFLKDWVLTHIAVMDKQYFTYLKSIATRKANGKLTVTANEVKHRAAAL